MLTSNYIACVTSATLELSGFISWPIFDIDWIIIEATVRYLDGERVRREDYRKLCGSLLVLWSRRLSHCTGCC